jgi:hypothetical protein
LQSTRETAAKFKACKGIDIDEHKDVEATGQRIHATEFAARSALKLAKSHGSRTQQAAGGKFFFYDRGVNVQAARTSGLLPVSQSPLLVAFANAAPCNSSTSAAESQCCQRAPANRRAASFRRVSMLQARRVTHRRAGSTIRPAASGSLPTWLLVKPKGARPYGLKDVLIRLARQKTSGSIDQ